MECCICTARTSKTATCPYCDFTSCKLCLKRFILSTPDDPNCMNCRRIFDRQTLQTIVSRVFVSGELKAHRENVLLDRELAMMPSTKDDAEAEVQRRRNQEAMDELNALRGRLLDELDRVNAQRRQLQHRMLHQPTREDARAFVHPCAQPACRGYLSTAWRCGVCHHYTCSECNMPRGKNRDTDGHVCADADRESVRAIQQDSRRCPNGHFVYRVSGCDQMWCTLCKTAFSWRDGRRINGAHLHNPHYFEFMRSSAARIAREHGDVPCGGIPDARELTDALGAAAVQFHAILRLVLHVQHEEMPMYAPGDDGNRDVRVRYLLSDIDKSALKKILQSREKRNEKRRDIGMVWNMYCDTTSDLLRQAVLDPSRADDVLAEHDALLAYTNSAFRDVARRYQCVAPVTRQSEAGFQVGSARHADFPPSGV